MSGSFLSNARRLPTRRASFLRPSSGSAVLPKAVPARMHAPPRPVPAPTSNGMHEAAQVAVTLLARQAARRSGILGIVLMMVLQFARPLVPRLSWPIVLGVAVALLGASQLCAAFIAAQPKQIIAERRYALRPSGDYASRHPAIRITRDSQATATRVASTPRTRRRVASYATGYVTSADLMAYRSASIARDLTLVAGLMMPLFGFLGGNRRGGLPAAGPTRWPVRRA